MLGVNENLSHFNMCRLILDGPSTIDFSFKSASYQLDFADCGVKSGYGYLIRRIDGDEVDCQLLMWLTLYFGESATDPYAVRNSTCSFMRGDLPFNTRLFLKYIRKVERRPLKSNPKWKNDFIHKSLSSYCLGVQMADMYMPYTLGLFALSIECLANASLDVRGKYSQLGSKGYKRIIGKVVRQDKNNDPEHRRKVREFMKYLDQEIDVIMHMRNAFYGHGLIYEPEHRKKLTQCMTDWMIKHGLEHKKSKRKWFSDKQLERSLEINKFALFKLAQNVNRILFAYYLGVSFEIPFTQYDFQVKHAPWDVIEYEHPQRIS